MKFKVGDRVAVYGSVSPSAGGSVAFVGGARGTVYTVQSNGALEIELDERPENFAKNEDLIVDGIHPKQCRRLVKKERKRVWVAADRYDMIRASSAQVHIGDIYTKPQQGFIEFVEVRRKK